MGLLKDEWNSTAFRLEIQNTNYPYKLAKEFNNLARQLDGYSCDHLAMSFDRWRLPVYRAPSSVQATCVHSTSTVPNENGGIFCRGFDSSSSYLSTLYTMDFMPRLNPVLVDASEIVNYWLTKYPTAEARTFRLNKTVDSQGRSVFLYEVKQVFTLSELLVFLQGKKTLGSYKIYTNTKGVEQTLLSTVTANSQSGGYRDVVTPFQWVMSSGASGTGFFAYLASCFSKTTWGSGAPIPRFFSSESSALHVIGLSLPDVSPALLDKGTYSTYIIYGTEKEWSRYFNGSGMMWSFNEDDVKDPDDDDLNKPITPGQPDNPEDDDDGDGDNESDDVEYPQPGYVPSAYSRYWIRKSDLANLKDFLFSQTFLNDIKRLWTNPGEYIVDCTFYPLIADSLGIVGGQEQILVGNMNSGLTGYIYPDGVSSYHYGGGFKIEPYYNSYLDYEPYTTMSIYIPYIGVRPLNASRITGHTLKLAYTFDFGTRQITAHLGLDGDMTLSGGDLGNALDQYTGSFGVSFPFSGSQNNQMVLNILQQSSKVISSAGAIAGGIATGNIASVAAGVYGMTTTSGHLTAETYGTLTPTAGLYSPQIPYLIINRPITAEPAGYKEREGYSAAYSGKVSSFTGFLKCATAEIPQSGTMTDSENKEIVRLLKEGVYL